MSKLLGLNSSSNALETLKSDGSGNLHTNPVLEQTVQILEQTLANGEDSTVMDCRGKRSIRIWGNNSTLSLLTLQYASTSDYNGSGQYDWQFCDTLMAIEYYGKYHINKPIDVPPPYIRIANETGASQQFSLRVLKNK